METTEAKLNDSPKGQSETKITDLSACIQLVPQFRAVIGMVCMSTDDTAEIDAANIFSRIPGINWRITRLQMGGDTITFDTYANVKRDSGVYHAAATFRPVDSLSCLGVMCTSLSMYLGAKLVAEELKRAHPQSTTTDMATAVERALSALGATRVCLLVPYEDEVANANVAQLESRGCTVVSAANLSINMDEITSRLSPEAILDCARRVRTTSEAARTADVMFLGCSAVRTCVPGLIDDMEAKLGCPVVSSAQAFLWDSLRQSGINDQIVGFGTLFKHH